MGKCRVCYKAAHLLLEGLLPPFWALEPETSGITHHIRYNGKWLCKYEGSTEIVDGKKTS